MIKDPDVFKESVEPEFGSLFGRKRNDLGIDISAVSCCLELEVRTSTEPEECVDSIANWQTCRWIM